jgi:hypothetical protein
MRPQCGTTRWVTPLAQIAPGDHFGTVSWSPAEDRRSCASSGRDSAARCPSAPSANPHSMTGCNTLDVAVEASSSGGRAFMDYLRSTGIRFMASWGAIPAQPLAPIHVGQLSPRLGATAVSLRSPVRALRDPECPNLTRSPRANNGGGGPAPRCYRFHRLPHSGTRPCSRPSVSAGRAASGARATWPWPP